MDSDSGQVADDDPAQVADADDDAVIAGYLRRVRKAARQLPSGRRDWVTAQVGDRIAAAIGTGEQAGAGHADAGHADAERGARAAVARLGDPAELVRAIDGHAAGTEARWMEFAAVLLVLAGGILWRPAWLIGVTLLWVSPRWRWTDKLLATLVWPGGLLVANLLVSRYIFPVLLAGGGTARHSFFSMNGFGGGALPGRAAEDGSFFVRPNGSFQYLLDSTLGHPPLRHLLVAAVPPVVVAIRLPRRARRPEQPQASAGGAGLTAPGVTGPIVTGPIVTGPVVTGPGAGTGPS